MSDDMAASSSSPPSSGSSAGPPGSGGDEDRVRVGFCAILGLPNAGKSTLLNRVLGIRLVAVSHKPQTTRNRILGVHNLLLPAPAPRHESGDEPGEATAGAPPDQRPAAPEPAQIIFVDTPGIQQGPGALRRYMRDQALAAAGDSDVSLLLVDVSDPAQRDPARFEAPDAAALAQTLRATRAPVLLAFNKIDTFKAKEALLPVMAAYTGSDLAQEFLPISAATGDGVSTLVEAIGRRLPWGPRLFPEDMVTDRAERFLAGELVREQLFHQLGQELPYATAVVVESFQERADRGDVVIEAVIYVERDSQKGIVVGKGGQRIKEVGQRARAAISQLLGCPAHVKLYVKVATNWSRIDRGIRQMGYE